MRKKRPIVKLDKLTKRRGIHIVDNRKKETKGIHLLGDHLVGLWSMEKGHDV